MRLHATIAAFLSAATAFAQTPTTPGRAVNGTLIESVVPSTNVQP
jgi:hypothetical protein